MAYSAEISRSNPSCFLFLIDQSGSMQDFIDPAGTPAIDRPPEERCPSGRGARRPHQSPRSRRRHQSAVAKPGHQVRQVRRGARLLSCRSTGLRRRHDGQPGRAGVFGALAGRELVPDQRDRQFAGPHRRADEEDRRRRRGARRSEDQVSDLVRAGRQRRNSHVPGVHPGALDLAGLDRPACSPAFRRSSSISPTAKRPTAIRPPPRKSSSRWRQTTAIVCCSTSTFRPAAERRVEFPDSEGALPDEFSRLLFNMSSILPTYMQAMARQEGIRASETTRGFVFNADMVAVIRFLDIGTRPSNLR